VALTNWTNTKGLTCLNLPNMLTWFHPTIPNQASIINLTFTNKALLLRGQVDGMAITDSPVPLTDHAALSLTYYPLISLTFAPPPTPTGYTANPKHHPA